MARTRFGAESRVPDSCSGLNSDPTHYPWIPDPHHKVVQTRRLWGGQYTFILIARKRNQVLWATTTTWGQIITYIISPWLSVLALISLQNLLTYFLMMLALLGILSQSAHFYFIWHETIRLLRVSLYHGSMCIYLFFFLITAETARVGLLSKLKENMSISGCV